MKLRVVDVDPALKEAIDEQQRLKEHERAERERESAALFESRARLHMIIAGNVQGVFFRAFVEEIANELNLAGWVRNNPDGSVELVAEGERKDLQTLERACREGPAAATVEDVRVWWGEFTGKFSSFTRRSE